MRLAIRVLMAGALCAAMGLAQAKLPPPTEAEKAKAEEMKAKASAAAEAEKAALAKAQDRVAERYIKEQAAKGIMVRPTPVTQATATVPSQALPGRPIEQVMSDSRGDTPKSAAAGAVSGAPATAAPTTSPVPAEAATSPSKK